MTGPSYFADHEPQFSETSKKTFSWLCWQWPEDRVKLHRSYRSLPSWVTSMSERENYYLSVVQNRYSVSRFLILSDWVIKMQMKSNVYGEKTVYREDQQWWPKGRWNGLRPLVWKEKAGAGNLSLRNCPVRSGPNSIDEKWSHTTGTRENQRHALAWD